jgi:hypothetical protein
MRYILAACMLAVVAHHFVPQHIATDANGQVLADVDGIAHAAADLRFSELRHAHDVIFADQPNE